MCRYSGGEVDLVPFEAIGIYKLSLAPTSNGRSLSKELSHTRMSKFHNWLGFMRLWSSLFP